MRRPPFRAWGASQLLKPDFARRCMSASNSSSRPRPIFLHIAILKAAPYRWLGGGMAMLSWHRVAVFLHAGRQSAPWRNRRSYCQVAPALVRVLPAWSTISANNEARHFSPNVRVSRNLRCLMFRQKPKTELAAHRPAIPADLLPVGAPEGPADAGEQRPDGHRCSKARDNKR